jgi:hypothetical protein
MSNDNNRLREFICPPVDLEKFLIDATNVKERLTSFNASYAIDQHNLDSVVNLAKSLSDYRHLEQQNESIRINNEIEEEEDNDDEEGDNEETTSSTWRTRRKKKKLDSTISNNLK